VLKALGGKPVTPTYPVVGVQFTGTVAANSSARWFTSDWPASWHVVWTVVPTSALQGAAQIGWNVQVERTSLSAVTYWINITNVSGADVSFEARYSVLGTT
jgi:hypothetical protein